MTTPKFVTFKRGGVTAAAYRREDVVGILHEASDVKIHMRNGTTFVVGFDSERLASDALVSLLQELEQ